MKLYLKFTIVTQIKCCKSSLLFFIITENGNSSQYPTLIEVAKYWDYLNSQQKTWLE